MVELRKGVACVIAVTLGACSGSPTGVTGNLPDGDYVVSTAEPRIVDEFATPGWMREMPVIDFSKEGPDFFVTGSNDDLVVLGPVQRAVQENGFWRVHFGWAEDEVHHYWEVLMNIDECAAAAIDADLGIPPTGALTVVLEECSITAG